jgi:hypothetical protein
MRDDAYAAANIEQCGALQVLGFETIEEYFRDVVGPFPQVSVKVLFDMRLVEVTLCRLAVTAVHIEKSFEIILSFLNVVKDNINNSLKNSLLILIAAVNLSGKNERKGAVPSSNGSRNNHAGV